MKKSFCRIQTDSGQTIVGAWSYLWVRLAILITSKSVSDYLDHSMWHFIKEADAKINEIEGLKKQVIEKMDKGRAKNEI